MVYSVFIVSGIMWKYSIGILFGILLSTNAFLIPDGYEIKYTYESNVKVVASSEDLTSQYDILAEIAIKNQNNGILVTFENFKYSVHAGSIHVNDTNILPPPEDIKKNLELPILIVNEGNHRVMKFHKNDILRSIKLKKAIALSLDKKVSDENYSKKLFSENNDTIKFRYSLRSKAENDKNEIITEDDFSVKKTIVDLCQKTSTETNILPKLGCQAPSYLCDVHEEFYTVQDSKGIFVWEITSSTSKSMPFEDYITTTSQKVRMVSISKTQTSEVNEEYVTIEEIESLNIPIDVDQLKLKVKTLLENHSEYFERKRIDLWKSLVDQDHSFIVLISHMKKLSEKDFLQIFDDLIKNDKVREMYSHVLPYVGTKEAIKTTCYLIKNKSVDEFLAIRMLQTIYRLKISKTNVFVKELVELTGKEAGLSDKIRWTATLAFAATLNNFGQIATNSPKDDFDEYANTYSKRLLDEKVYKEKFLSVNALSNMQTGNVSSIIEKIIGGKGSFANLDPHLRSLSMLSGLQYIRDVSNKEDGKKIVDTYMPIFLNKADNIEVRSMALYVLMKTNDPRIWTKLFEQMDKEDENIRCFYHNILKNIAESDTGCYKKNNDIANALLKKSFDFIGSEIIKYNNQLQDFIDPLKNIGNFRSSIMFGNMKRDRFITMLFDQSFSVKNSIFDEITLYLNIRSTNDSDDFSDDLMSIFQTENLRIELLEIRHNVIVSAAVYESFIELLLSEYGNFLRQPEKIKALQILNHQTDFNNEIGMPVKMYFDHSNIYELKSLKPVSVSYEQNSLQLSYKEQDNIEYGIKVFNPITNKWHGVRRVQSIDKLFGIDINHKSDFSITMKTTVDINPFTEYNENVGFKSIGQTEAFIINEEIIDQSCEDIIHIPIRTNKNLTVWEYDDDYTGLLYQFKIFDCNEEVLENYKTHIKNLIMDKMKTMSILSISNTFGSVIDYVTLFPGSGTCGIGFSVEASKIYPMTHFRFGISHEPGKNIGLFINTMKESKEMTSCYIEPSNIAKNNVEFEIKRHSIENEIYKETCIRMRREISKISLLEEIKVINGNCSQDESIVHMKLEGRKTNENDPNLENTMYKKCISNPKYKHIICATEATAFRDYTIQIHYKNLIDTQNESGRILLQLNYPANETELVDIVCKDPPDWFGDVRVKLDYRTWPYLTMPQSVFGYRSMAIRENECKVTMDHTTGAFYNEHHFSLNNTWKLLLSDCHNSTCSWKILAKRVSDVQETMAIRIEIENSKVVFYKIDQVHVETDMYVPKQNGSFITMGSVEYKLLDDGKVALIYMKDRDILIGYDGLSAKISLPFKKNFSDGDLCST